MPCRVQVAPRLYGKVNFLWRLEHSLVILDYMEDILFIKQTLENRHFKVVITDVGKDWAHLQEGL